MDDSIGINRLRAHLRGHNRRVLGLTLMTSSLSVILWLVLWMITWWLFLLGGVAIHPMEFTPSSTPLAHAFIITAVILCIVAWITRRLRPNQAPRDTTTLRDHLVDIILAIPRLTLSILGTATAAARLSDTELDHAWTLLRRMDASPTPIPVQSLPVDIPNPASLNKILLALQLSELIDIRPTPTGPVLAFHNTEARHLTQDRVRLRF
jgi:hypothetical protein